MNHPRVGYTGVRCRLHDLRHTFATRPVENGDFESTMLALIGQMIRAMLERYWHIRNGSEAGSRVGDNLASEGAELEIVPVVAQIATIQ